MSKGYHFSVYTKILAVILAVLTILFTLPLSVFAESLTGNTEGIIAEKVSDKESGQVACSFLELPEERSLFSKVIRSSDGKTTVAEYGMPVHIQDENGRWVDIDNRLTEKEGCYITGNTDIRLAGVLSPGSFVFSLDDGRISVRLPSDEKINASKGKVTVSEKGPEEKTDLERLTALENLTAAITYPNVYPCTDFRYTATPNGVKQEIILEKRTDSHDYSFILQANGLRLEKDDSGQILAVNPENGETEYVLPAPFAYDSAENYTDDKHCGYSLYENEDGSYTVTVTVDAEWMNAEERVFPVTVDPTVYYGGYGQLNMRDTMVSQAYPSSNYGTRNYLKTGYDAANRNVYIYIAPWSLPSIPAGAYISEAKLNLTANGSSQLPSQGGTFVARKILHPGYSSIWGETSVTWNTGCTYGDILDYQNISAPSAGTVVSWDITSAVRDWYRDSASFQGIAVMQYNTSATATRTVQFRSSESTDSGSSYRPFFTYTYVSTLGLEDYYSFFSSDAGLAGTGYVSAFAGSLTFSKSLLSTTDSLFPYTTGLVYNSALSGKTYTYPNAQTAYGSGSAPYGFKLNMQETVIRKSYKNEFYADTYFYIWADGDGTEHWFHRRDESADIYEDEDGLQLTLESESNDGICIKDDSGTVRHFSETGSNLGNDVYGSWYLKSIEDASHNVINFVTDSRNRPTAVQLIPYFGGSAITFLNISYDSTSGLPYAIWNGTTKEAVVFRYSQTYNGNVSTAGQKYLRQLVYLRGNAGTTVNASTWSNYYYNGISSGLSVNATVYYTYDSAGRITSARDGLSQYEIRYTWTSGKVASVQKYGGTSAGQKISISYFDGYTEIRNSGPDDAYGTADDFVTRYVFDDSARTVSTYSTDVSGTRIYGASSGEYVADNEKAKNSIRTATTVGGSSSSYLLNGGFEFLNSSVSADSWFSTGNVRFLKSDFQAGGLNEADIGISGTSTASLYQYTRLPSGTYTFSMSVRTFDCEGVTARVRAVSLSNSSHICSEEIPVNMYSASGSESTFSFSFRVADTSVGEAYKIVIEVAGGNGTSTGAVLSVDNVMLEKGEGCSSFNHVRGDNFEEYAINSANVLQDTDILWNDNDGTPSFVNVSAPFGRVLEVSADISMERNVSQVIYRAPAEAMDQYDEYGHSDYDEPEAGRKFKVSAFSKGTGQVRNNNTKYEIRVEVQYYFGYNHYGIDEFSFAFTEGCRDWQFVCGNFGTRPEALVASVTVYCVYSCQPSGYALFDSVSVVEVTDGSVVDYAYYGEDDGEKAGLLHIKNSGYNEETYEYNSNRQLTRIANNHGELHDYLYDAGNVYRLTDEICYSFTLIGRNIRLYPNTVTDPDSRIVKTPKTRTVYIYNNNGQVSETRTFEVKYGADGSSLVPKPGTGYVITSSAYDEAYGSVTVGALLSQIDSLARETRFTYDECGRLKSTVNVTEGTGTYYDYDAVGNLSGVYPAEYHSSQAIPDRNHQQVEYGYNGNNRLESILTASTEYILDYDAFGNRDSVYAGDYLLAEYEYNPNNGKISKVFYGDSGSRYVRYIYDSLENISEIRYKNGNTAEQTAFRYHYTAYGQLSRVDNLLTGKSTSYRYNPDGKLASMVEYDTEDAINEFGTSVFYNEEGQTEYLGYSLDYSGTGGTTTYNWNYSMFYNSNGSIREESVAAGNIFAGTSIGSIEYTYDGFERLTQKEYRFGAYSNTVSYTFSSWPQAAVRTSAQVESYSSQVNNGTAVTSAYTYDGAGNITKIHQSNGVEYRYQYDDLGQLVREDNTALSRTVTYEYDDAGNIKYKRTYALTAEGASPSGTPVTGTYGYNDASWGDLLTSYNGVSITYDGIGNPLSYYNGSSYTFSWQNGRQLATAVKGSQSLSFAYNDEGIRTRKTVNGTDHIYHVSGSQIEAEEWGSNLLIYLYDAEGSPIGMQYRGTGSTFYTFWVEKNLQGDIVAVYNQSGVKCISYVYDAWGNTTRTVHNGSGTNAYAQYNPFTYRGYYYDSETGLYYVSSRYYDPEVGRFINADEIDYLGADGSLTGYNLFAYCGNNPVMGYDPEGTFNWNTFWKGASIALVGITAIASVVTAGCAAPALAAAIAIASGTACIGLGAAEIVESVTDYNVIRDGLMGGNEQLYNTVRSVTEFTASISTIAVNVGAAINKAANPNMVCFIEGTLVLTAEGCVPIEHINPGDYVIATDPDTGETALKEVVQLFRNKTNEWVHLTINGEEIICTPEHPFYSPVKGWTSACNLRAGDILVTVNGEYVVLEKIQHELLEAPETTYNFEVEGFHTYYVGSAEVLVHNLCKQEMVAGSKKGWNARVSVGGEANHKMPHAHVFWKNTKLASVDVEGKFLAGTLDGKGVKFVKDNLAVIAEGIRRIYGG